MTTIKHYKYNKNLHTSATKLGGVWKDSQWHFDDAVVDKAKKLKAKWEGELVLIEIKAKEDVTQWRGPVYFAGYELCRAFDRDSGAKLSGDVYMLNGKITSGGSRANWVTKIEEGTTFRIKILKSMLDKAMTSKYFEVSIPDTTQETELADDDIID